MNRQEEVLFLYADKKVADFQKKSLGTFQKNSRNISEKLSEHFRKTLGTF
ncbi:hypothetical protein HMPREF1869_00140 [Bacteroidales bacterium KA00251]|nr:hypothetical protein HMPREF1869_00140 [Bacteroidales bacterium KA00251]